MDNAFFERPWRNLKYEVVYLKAYESMAEAREQIVISFGYDNLKHRGLNRQTPDQAFCSEPQREVSVLWHGDIKKGVQRSDDS